MSDKTSIMELIVPERGIRNKCLFPTSFFAIRGPRRARNAIFPATEVATPASNVAVIINIIFSFVRDTPSPIEISSPRYNKSRILCLQNVKTINMMIKGDAGMI